MSCVCTRGAGRRSEIENPSLGIGDLYRTALGRAKVLEKNGLEENGAGPSGGGGGKRGIFNHRGQGQPRIRPDNERSIVWQR